MCFRSIHWLLLTLAWLATISPLAARQPNILLIVSDDLGYGDLGCYGNREILSPNLDRLAREGARLTNFYVAWPACTPSRASLMTGRYPQRHGLYDMIRNEAPDYGKRYTPEEYAVTFERVAGLDVREVLLADMLSEAGYNCGMVGKWDLGMQRRFLPLARGFDFFYGFANTGIDYFTHERYGVPSMYRGNDPTREDRGRYATWLFEREAERFIRASADRPFFLYVAFNAPHGASNLDPQVRGAAQATPELQALYASATASSDAKSRNQQRRINHMAAITGMDQSIGRLLQLLDELRLTRDTVVIFLSDNGASGAGNNGGLRGGKGDVWEGGIRVPCIVRYPAIVPANTNCDAFLTSLEIVPSVLRMADAKPPRGVVFDGYDWVPVLSGTMPSVRTKMFWQRRNLKAARIRNWKWVDTPDGGGLFDLTRDIAEKHDLSLVESQIATWLSGEFELWQREMASADPREPFRDF